MPSYQIRRRADLDVDEIADYIACDNVSAGRKFIRAFKRECELLAEFPRIGAIREDAPRILKGLRSWPIKGFRNYLVFYVPGDDGVEIIRVMHGARDVMKSIDDD